MSSQTDLDKLQEELIEYAIQIAESFKVKLDYSDNSIKKVEKVLSKIHKDFKRNKNEEGLNGIALEFAFYIIKVIETNHKKGKLERDYIDVGKDSFPYYWIDSTIFPYSWCLKRIFNGSSDNIWSKYKALILKR